MKTVSVAAALKKARRTSKNAILYGFPPARPGPRRLFRVTMVDSRRFNAAPGGVAAKRSSWGIQGANARSSFATRRERTFGASASPLLISTHFVPITFLPARNAADRGTLSQTRSLSAQPISSARPALTRAGSRSTPEAPSYTGRATSWLVSAARRLCSERSASTGRTAATMKVCTADADRAKRQPKLPSGSPSPPAAISPCAPSGRQTAPVLWTFS